MNFSGWVKIHFHFFHSFTQVLSCWTSKNTCPAITCHYLRYNHSSSLIVELRCCIYNTASFVRFPQEISRAPGKCCHRLLVIENSFAHALVQRGKRSTQTTVTVKKQKRSAICMYRIRVIRISWVGIDHPVCYLFPPQVYKDQSEAFVRHLHPNWTANAIKKEAAKTFLETVKPFFEVCLSKPLCFY